MMPSSSKREYRSDEHIALKSVRIDGALNGLVLDVLLEQRYRNQSPRNIEAIYTFPLPAGAVLLDMSILLGDKKLSARVAAKEVAEASYESAIAQGDAAVMVEVNADGSYTLNLGNLAANEDCTVSLRYARMLDFAKDGLRLQIPTVIASRFGNPLVDARLQPHQVTSQSINAHYQLSLNLRIPEQFSGSVSSPSHSIQVGRDDAGTVVSLAQAASMDRDFILVIADIDATSLATTVADTVVEGHFVALASFMPRMPEADNSPLAVKILVDCSGSMAGDSILAARLAIDDIVGRFRAEDRFSLSRFGSTVEHASARPRLASPSAMRMARQWTKSLEADLGGTEMTVALESTIRLGVDRSADILLITDGAIHAIDSVVQIARESKQRVFVVGIGSSPAERHLRLLAESTGGACDFIAPGEDPGPAILRMFARLSTPCWDDVEVVWPVQPVWHSTCTRLFDGDTYHASAMFAERPTGEVTLNASGKKSGRAVLASAEILLAREPQDTLARMAALARCGAMPERTEKERVALDYCLLTAYTNFVLVHERANQDKALDMPALHVLPQMMAAGASGFGTVCGTRSPRYSVDARLPRMPALWRRADVIQSTAPDTGITPLALASLLSSGLKESIEVSYAGLEEAGVGRAIVTWLEHEFGDLDEYIVVWTFLFVMDAEPMRNRLLRRNSVSDIVGKVMAMLQSDAVRVQGLPSDVDGAVAQRLLSAMSEVTAEHWGGLGGTESEHAELDIPDFLKRQSD